MQVIYHFIALYWKYTEITYYPVVVTNVRLFHNRDACLLEYKLIKWFLQLLTLAWFYFLIGGKLYSMFKQTKKKKGYDGSTYKSI